MTCTQEPYWVVCLLLCRPHSLLLTGLPFLPTSLSTALRSSPLLSSAQLPSAAFSYLLNHAFHSLSYLRTNLFTSTFLPLNCPPRPPAHWRSRVSVTAGVELSDVTKVGLMKKPDCLTDIDVACECACVMRYASWLFIQWERCAAYLYCSAIP